MLTLPRVFTVGNTQVPPSNLPMIKLLKSAPASKSTAFQLKVTSHSVNTKLWLVIVQFLFTLLFASIPDAATFGWSPASVLTVTNPPTVKLGPSVTGAYASLSPTGKSILPGLLINLCRLPITLLPDEPPDKVAPLSIINLLAPVIILPEVSVSELVMVWSPPKTILLGLLMVRFSITPVPLIDWLVLFSKVKVGMLIVPLLVIVVPVKITLFPDSVAPDSTS